jgi:hypothetical protein
LRTGGWLPFFEGATSFPPISSGSFYPSHCIHCLWYQSSFPNQNRSPCRKSDLNHLPVIARVRQPRTSSCAHQTRFFSLYFSCLCMLLFSPLKLCFGRSVPITTNIEILARSAQFVGKGLLHQADSVTCALTRLHAPSRMRVIVALIVSLM